MKKPFDVIPVPFCSLFVAITIAAAPGSTSAGEATIRFERTDDRLQININERPLATYVFRDKDVLRPYFCNVHAPDGTRVTRRHPPRDGRDSDDHATMHPGVWLAFGDLSGFDFWRNRARVEHVEFVEQPRVANGTATFVVKNRYRAKDTTVCTEQCRHTIQIRPNGHLLVYDSQFQSERPLVFGDQEEMGLGVRLDDRLRVKGGNGRIVTSDGRRNEREVRGSNAAWCDYGGSVDGRRVGVVLMPGPQNFRSSWYHARDYGFVAANPFGRQALTGGEQSRVVVEPSKTLRLQFGVLIYATADDGRLDVDAEYKHFAELVDRQAE